MAFQFDNNTLSDYALVKWKDSRVRQINYNGNKVWEQQHDIAIYYTTNEITVRQLRIRDDDITYALDVDGVETVVPVDSDATSINGIVIKLKLIKGDFYDYIILNDLVENAWNVYDLSVEKFSKTVTITQGAMNDYSGTNFCQNKFEHDFDELNHCTFFTRTAFTTYDQYGDPERYQYRDWQDSVYGTTYSGSVGWGRTGNTPNLPCYAWAEFQTLTGTYRIEIPEWTKGLVSDRWYYASNTGVVEYGVPTLTKVV